MIALLLIPAILSFLVGAAHWLREGNLVCVALCLLAPFLLSVRKGWVVRVIQVMLVLIALEWLGTIMIIMKERQADDLPWHRMAIILGSVAAFTLISAMLFATPPLKRRYFLVGD